MFERRACVNFLEIVSMSDSESTDDEVALGVQTHGNHGTSTLFIFFVTDFRKVKYVFHQRKLGEF